MWILYYGVDIIADTHMLTSCMKSLYHFVTVTEKADIEELRNGRMENEGRKKKDIVTPNYLFQFAKCQFL